MNIMNTNHLTSSSKQQVYRMFTEYYGNPKMTKTENKGIYSIYMCKIPSLLLVNMHKYIIAMVEQDVYMKGTVRPLGDLQWIVFQTRDLPVKYDVSTQSYMPKRMLPYSSRIELRQRTNESCVYTSVEYPIEITLLYNDEESMYNYPEKGTIASALETFQTVVVFANV